MSKPLLYFLTVPSADRCVAFFARGCLFEDPDRAMSLWCVWGDGSVTESDYEEVTGSEKGRSSFIRSRMESFGMALPEVWYSSHEDPNLSVQRWYESFGPALQAALHRLTERCRLRGDNAEFTDLQLSFPPGPEFTYEGE